MVTHRHALSAWFFQLPCLPIEPLEGLVAHGLTVIDEPGLTDNLMGLCNKSRDDVINNNSHLAFFGYLLHKFLSWYRICVVFLMLLLIRQINNYGTQRLLTYYARVWDYGTELYFLSSIFDRNFIKIFQVKKIERERTALKIWGRLKVEVEPSSATTTLATTLTTTTMVKVTALERVETFFTGFYTIMTSYQQAGFTLFMTSLQRKLLYVYT